MWCFIQTYLKATHVAWRTCMCRIWEIMYNTYNVLLHHINCFPVDVLVEKRCITLIYSIINSEHSLHSRIALYSLYNDDTTLGETNNYIFHVQNCHTVVHEVNGCVLAHSNKINF